MNECIKKMYNNFYDNLYLGDEVWFNDLNCVAVMGGRWQWNPSKTNISPSLKPSGRRWKKFGEDEPAEEEENIGVTDIVKPCLPHQWTFVLFRTGNWTTPIYANSLVVPSRSPSSLSSQSTAPKEACLTSCWMMTSPSTGASGERKITHSLIFNLLNFKMIFWSFRGFSFFFLCVSFLNSL